MFLKKDTPKLGFKGLRTGILCSFEFYKKEILTLPEKIYLLCHRRYTSLKSKYYFSENVGNIAHSALTLPQGAVRIRSLCPGLSSSAHTGRLEGGDAFRRVPFAYAHSAMGWVLLPIQGARLVGGIA